MIHCPIIQEYENVRDYQVTIEDISISAPKGTNKISLSVGDGIRDDYHTEDQEFEFGKPIDIDYV